MEVQRGMTRQAIEMRIRRKVAHWVNTLPDNLQDRARRSAIVTGGSITSMLVGEPVNDFDIYFSDGDVAEELAKHYVEQFNDASRSAPQICVERVEVDRVAIRVASAGVAQDESETSDEGEELSDPAGLISRRKEDADGLYRPVFLSENAITLSDQVQLVLRFIGNPDEIHKNYDFVHATNYWHLGRLVLRPAALECTLSRRLVYQGSRYPLATLFRIRKFLDRGWKIAAGEMVKIALQISQLDLLDYATLREQLIGVDAAYFRGLMAALEEYARTGKELHAGYIINLIDELSDNPNFGDGAI